MQQPPPATPAQSGIDKKTGSTLAYLVIWVTGLIFLFVGKHDPDIKYNAAQSVVFFGSLTVLSILISIGEQFLGALYIVGVLLGLIEFFAWLYCLYKAWTGGGVRFEIPVVGGAIRPYAEQLANSIN